MGKKKRLAAKRAVPASSSTARKRPRPKKEESDSAAIERAVYDGMQDLRTKTG